MQHRNPFDSAAWVAAVTGIKATVAVHLIAIVADLFRVIDDAVSAGWGGAATKSTDLPLVAAVTAGTTRARATIMTIKGFIGVEVAVNGVMAGAATVGVSTTINLTDDNT
jgi:hypothetical protein